MYDKQHQDDGEADDEDSEVMKMTKRTSLMTRMKMMMVTLKVFSIDHAVKRPLHIVMMICGSSKLLMLMTL